MHRIEAGGTTLVVDDSGAWQSVSLGGRDLPLSGLQPRFVLAGQPAVVRSVNAGDGGVVVSLAGESREGTLRLEPHGDAIRCRIDIVGGDAFNTVRIELPLPLGANTLHLPTGYTYGQALDAEHTDPFPCNFRNWAFAALEWAGGVLSLISHSARQRIPRGSWAPVWKAGACVQDGILWFQMECLTGEPWEIAVDPSLSVAAQRYHAHLEHDYGAVPWRNDPSTPSWFGDLKMVITLDMLRSQGEAAHTYGHVVGLCRELKAAGLGGGILFYLPGYQNRYDAGYPLYGPHEALGGETGFREMVAAIHDAGHWVMPHLCVWGADPCQRYFDEIEHMAVPWSEAEVMPHGHVGPWAGWPSLMPPTPLAFDTGVLPLQPRQDGDSVVFDTPAMPEPLEAYLTLGNVQGDGRVWASLLGREVGSKQGELAAGGCRFRFRFRFTPGVNQVRLTFEGGSPDLSQATFRIDDAVHFATQDTVWTHPIVRMPVADPRWIELTRAQLCNLVERYQVDALHFDAANINVWAEAPMYRALRQALPLTLFGCEGVADLGHSVFHISQGGQLPPEGPHRVTDLSRRLNEPYLKFYYHLCKTPAFVPGSTVCNHDPVPAALTEEASRRAERMWREGPAWDVLPNIRLNYRDFGLDPRTRAALCEVLATR